MAFFDWFSANKKQKELENVMKKLNNRLNSNFKGVDWSLAPQNRGVNEWIYDERAQCGRWLTGNFEVQEFGCLWEWFPAPDFGATDAMRVKRTPEDDLLLKEVEHLAQKIKEPAGLLKSSKMHIKLKPR